MKESASSLGCRSCVPHLFGRALRLWQKASWCCRRALDRDVNLFCVAAWRGAWVSRRGLELLRRGARGGRDMDHRCLRRGERDRERIDADLKAYREAQGTSSAVEECSLYPTTIRLRSSTQNSLPPYSTASSAARCTRWSHRSSSQDDEDRLHQDDRRIADHWRRRHAVSSFSENRALHVIAQTRFARLALLIRVHNMARPEKSRDVIMIL